MMPRLRAPRRLGETPLVARGNKPRPDGGNLTLTAFRRSFHARLRSCDEIGGPVFGLGTHAFANDRALQIGPRLHDLALKRLAHFARRTPDGVAPFGSTHGRGIPHRHHGKRIRTEAVEPLLARHQTEDDEHDDLKAWHDQKYRRNGPIADVVQPTHDGRHQKGGQKEEPPPYEKIESLLRGASARKARKRIERQSACRRKHGQRRKRAPVGAAARTSLEGQREDLIDGHTHRSSIPEGKRSKT